MVRQLPSSSVLAMIAATLLGSAAPAVVRAEPFDFIFYDQVDVGFFGTIDQVMSSENDIGLLVNKSGIPFGRLELRMFEYEITSTPAGHLVLTLGINSLNTPQVVPPIQPNEAVGSSSPGSPLVQIVRPGETFRSTDNLQFNFIGIQRVHDNYQGPVRFDVRMRMGEHEATFVINATVSLQDNHLTLGPHATRVSSKPIATSSKKTTWGRLKKLYR